MKDSLADWLSIRGALVEPACARVQATTQSGRDGHAAFLRQQVQPRDPTRYARLTRALALARSEARARELLSFSRLASWQRHVLGTDQVTFRATDAFAKQGRERYGLAPGTKQRFEHCLGEANGTLASPSLRAARAYLDVLFFHPFADGNARAATLTLDFVLAREGIVLEQVAPLYVVSRRADDAAGAQAFVCLLEMLGARGQAAGAYEPRRSTCSRQL